MTRGRNAKLRMLNRYSVRTAYPHATVSGHTDWDRPVFIVRPRDFQTVLARIEAAPGTSPRDLTDLMNAVSALCDQPAPEPRQ